MRDPQGREIIRTSTMMRAAFGAALEAATRACAQDGEVRDWASPTVAMVTEVYVSGAGRRKAPAWSIRRKGGQA